MDPLIKRMDSFNSLILALQCQCRLSEVQTLITRFMTVGYANTTFPAWQPLQSITIVTTGSPGFYTTELWAIYYESLGPI